MELTLWRAWAVRCSPHIVLLACLLFPGNVQAADPESAPASTPTTIVLKHTPPGRGISIDERGRPFPKPPRGDYRIYTFEEWKELVIADNRITVLVAERAMFAKEREHLLEVEALRAKEVATLKADFATERAIADRVTKKWETCDGKLLRCKAGAMWPWIVAGVGGALAVAGGTALLITLLKK